MVVIYVRQLIHSVSLMILAFSSYNKRIILVETSHEIYIVIINNNPFYPSDKKFFLQLLLIISVMTLHLRILHLSFANSNTIT